MVDQVRKVEGAVKGLVSKVVGRLQFSLSVSLPRVTRIETGFAASGWMPSVGRLEVQTQDRSDVPELARAEASLRRAKNQTRARAILSTYSIDKGKVFVANGTPYIRFVTTDRAITGAINKSIERTLVSVATKT